MNTMIKGSIAGATGIALLMGGFGTYAVWSDSENLAENGVQSGQLNIDTAAGVYDDANTTASDDWTATDKLVPGDKVTYTQVFTVKGDGKNLAGTIKLNTQAMSPNGFAGTGSLTRSVDVVASGAGATSVTKDNATEFSFSDPFGTATLTATVTYTFPSSVTNDQNKSATTPASTFTITQS